jgi:DNA repair protein SbcC/Rad50
MTMLNTDSFVASLSERLIDFQELGDGIYKGHRKFEGKTFATAYIDLSDHVVERAKSLESFQESLLGNDFFNLDGDQRWNSYLFFLAGPESINAKGFEHAKSEIERNRHFARKFVVTEDDLLDRLKSIDVPISRVSEDISFSWGQILREANLGCVLEQIPRTQMLEKISSGEAFEETVFFEPLIGELDDTLGRGFINHLKVGKFRPILNNRDLTFGNVNLIFGPNGTGKTSLLEAIEAFYCGRVKRDSSTNLVESIALILSPEGNLIPVESNVTPSDIKARNVAWYGRSNQQSSAISNSFTRFNFLDTDAAFRLANENDVDKIREDLDLLLVGAEAATLWTYITKLHQDCVNKEEEYDKQIPMLTDHVHNLQSEVERLKTLPSEAITLVKTYKSNLRNLNVKWQSTEEQNYLDEHDRINFEYLLNGLDWVLSIIEPNANRASIDELLRINLQREESLQEIIKEHNKLTAQYVETDNEYVKLEKTRSKLEEWLKFCEADVPLLVSKITQQELSVAKLRGEVGSISIDEIKELPSIYARLTLVEAITLANKNLLIAIEAEQRNTDIFNERQQFNRTLVDLRSDLRDLAITIINRTGNSNSCPVCLTPHLEGALLQKIEELAISNIPLSENLTNTIVASRELVAKEKEALKTLQLLEIHSKISETNPPLTCEEIRNNLFIKHHELELLNSNLSSLNESFKSLEKLGINGELYNELRAVVSNILDKNASIDKFDTIKEAINKLIIVLENNRLSSQSLQIDIVDQCINAREISGKPDDGISLPYEVLKEVQEVTYSIQKSTEFLENASNLISINSDINFEDLRWKLKDILNDFDRAQHAIQTESTARTDLKIKSDEYDSAIEFLEAISKNRDNLSKANKVFFNLIENYSLEKATKEAQNSIGINIRDIFKRIHTPAEYTLGDLSGDSFLSTSKEGKRHGFNQISTGQRAAVALSIFLALNRSATNAPPLMLIDDPVAHIDDLNALAFLDYLRDIAVSSRRQIFFATADAKFAALFQRKFEFLGNDRFKKIILKREVS